MWERAHLALAVRAPLPQASAPEVHPADAQHGVEEQLGARHAAEQQAARLHSQLEELQRERALLQEQVLALQQEVAGLQHAAAARGGTPEAPAVARSPSRTLNSRLRELVSPRRASPPVAAPGPGGPSGLLHIARFSPPHAEAVPRAQAAPPALQEQQQQQEEQLAALQQALQQEQRRAQELEAQLGEARAASVRAEQRFSAAVGLLNARAAQAEEAAEQVLQVHASTAALGKDLGASPEHSKCRQIVEGLHAQASWGRDAHVLQPGTASGLPTDALAPIGQVWRERLARQKVEVQLSHAETPERQPTATLAGEEGAAAVDVDQVDEQAASKLEAEAQRADHVARGLAGEQAHQRRLARRVEGLEQQLAEWAVLLHLAGQVQEVPPLSPTRAGGSPARQAISVLMLRRAQEEARALQARVQQLQGEVASLRRRERASAKRTKHLVGLNQDLTQKQHELAAGTGGTLPAAQPPPALPHAPSTRARRRAGDAGGAAQPPTRCTAARQPCRPRARPRCQQGAAGARHSQNPHAQRARAARAVAPAV